MQFVSDVDPRKFVWWFLQSFDFNFSVCQTIPAPKSFRIIVLSAYPHSIFVTNKYFVRNFLVLTNTQFRCVPVEIRKEKEMVKHKQNWKPRTAPFFGFCSEQFLSIFLSRFNRIDETRLRQPRVREDKNCFVVDRKSHVELLTIHKTKHDWKHNIRSKKVRISMDAEKK